MRIVVLGLSITSSWGNGHATNYRALLAALEQRGHDVLFLERDVPWYARTRDFDAPFVHLYASLDDLRDRFETDVAEADLVVHGSFVPEVGPWLAETAGGVLAFYDIDTPITLAAVEAGTCEYLSGELIPRYDLYLSFTGGPTLGVLERRHGARRARPFFCLVDTQRYRPVFVEAERRYALGYLGTYDAERQATIERLLLEPARALPHLRFAVAGPQYPPEIDWPANVERIEHVAPGDHPRFYASQRLTLNATRCEMAEAGWSPSVRLFEAAACGVPVISDWWPGLDEFFRPGDEILVARDADDTLRILRTTSDEELRRIGARARVRVLRDHTAEHRARQLEALVAECLEEAGVA
jgi:spore maturation protein CgeB